MTVVNVPIRRGPGHALETDGMHGPRLNEAKIGIPSRPCRRLRTARKFTYIGDGVSGLRSTVIQINVGR